MKDLGSIDGSRINGRIIERNVKEHEMQQEFWDSYLEEKNMVGACAYLLSDDAVFYPTAYKVMKNSINASLLPCHKLRYNGQLKFVYFTEDLYSLDDYICSSQTTDVISVMLSMAKALGEVKSNGFLNVACIDNRLSHLYVDKTRRIVKFIYLPVHAKTGTIVKSEFENEIRTQLLSLFSNIHIDQNSEMQPLIAALRDGTMTSLAELPNRLNINKNELPPQRNETGLQLISTKGKADIEISKFPFLIGKNPQKVDGVIADNSAVSRIHCEIKVDSNGKYAICDLGSANGTFVNQQRANANVPIPITTGDMIKIANEEYLVQE